MDKTWHAAASATPKRLQLTTAHDYSLMNSFFSKA
jgi:hypothetical protein